MKERANLSDDPSIPDNEFLYCTVHRTHVKKEENRPSSAAFKKWHISVDRSSLSSPRETLDRQPNHTHVAQVSAGQARATENVGGVASDPIMSDPIIPDNPAHAQIFPEENTTKNVWYTVTARKLAKASSWAFASES